MHNSILEMISVELPSNSTVEDSSTSTGQLWLSITESLKQKGGFHSMYWGRRLEAPGTLAVCISWLIPNIQYRSILDDPTSKFSTGLRSLSAPDTIPTVRAVSVPTILMLSSPVLEVATFTSPSKDFESKFSSFLSIAIRPAPGFLGVTYGFCQTPTGQEEPIEKEFVALLGWISLEAHQNVTEAEGFNEAAGAFIPEVGSVEAWHVQLATV